MSACRFILAAIGVVLLVGCAEPLNTMYGRAGGGGLPASVNGTDVLAGMFSEAGHDVTTRRVLVTSKFDSVNTIVWFPDDFSAPNEETCKWFDNWLAEGPGRTLIYVGRDFNAAPLYWRAMLPSASTSQRAAYRQELEEALARENQRNFGLSPNLECAWFKVNRETRRKVRELAGTWSAGIDADNVEIELRDRLVPRPPSGRQLTSEDDILVSMKSKVESEDSRVIMVANGSFLLNAPLVNREHRVLANRLIASVGAPGRVVFLESGVGGPTIDPPLDPMGLWRMFGAWPLNVILLHLAALGIIFCFARWPIFGRPKVPAAETTSDFGIHVDAVSNLLRRTGDRQFALGRLGDARPGSGK